MKYMDIKKYLSGVLRKSFPNKTTLDKLSTSESGKLLFDGSQIEDGGSLPNQEVLEKFSLSESGTLLFDGAEIEGGSGGAVTLLNITIEDEKCFGKELICENPDREIIKAIVPDSGVLVLRLCFLGEYTIICGEKIKKINCDKIGEILSVTIPAITLVPWSSGTDEQILAMIEGYYNEDLTLEDIQSVWSVGDSRTMSISKFTFSGYTGVGNKTVYDMNIDMVIIDFDHDELTEYIGNKSKALITIQVKSFDNTNNNYLKMDTVYNYWHEPTTTQYNFLNSESGIYGHLVTGLKSVIKIVNKHYIIPTKNDNNVYEYITEAISNDKIFLLSEKEVFGVIGSKGRDTELNKQYKYYETASNRIKSNMVWWLRSNYYNNDTILYISCVNSNGTFWGRPWNDGHYGAFAFCL